MNGNNQNSYVGKLDEQMLVFKHLDRLSRLSTKLEDSYEDSWGIYAHRFQLGVSTLKSFLQPLIDDQFKNRIEELRDKFDKEEDWNHIDQINFNRELLNELIMLLHRNNAYWGTEEKLVVDDEEKEAVTVD